MTSTDLVRLCGSDPHNELAWREFINRFHRSITIFVIDAFNARTDHSICLEKLQQQEKLFDFISVYDLVQEVYLRLLKNNGQALRTFRGCHERSIYAYLAKIAKTVVTDHLRRLTAMKRTSHDTLPIKRDNQAVTEELIGRLQWLPTASETQRNLHILWLHVVEGLTAREIASRPDIDLKLSGVGSVLRRTKHNLREQY